MPTLGDNPFAVLTAVVAPAILTNASSVLCLGTANRIARVVDRTRVIAAELKASSTSGTEYEGRMREMAWLRVRAKLLLRALRLFYASIGAFVAAALVSVIGSALAAFDFRVAFQAAAAIGLVIGAAGVVGLVSGCTVMVHETRLAVQTLGEEAQRAHPL